MAFLILSFAIKNELKKWKEYDKIFKQDLLNLSDKESFTILNITTLKSRDKSIVQNFFQNIFINLNRSIMINEIV